MPSPAGVPGTRPDRAAARAFSDDPQGWRAGDHPNIGRERADAAGGRNGCGGRGRSGRRRMDGGSSRFGGGRRQARAGLAIDAQGHLDAGNLVGVETEGFENPIGIIGLDPRTQEARRGRQMHHVLDQFLELEAGKPGGKDILTHTGLEPRTHPVPQIALAFGRVGAAHDRFFAFDGGKGGRGIGLNPIVSSGGGLSHHLSCPNILLFRLARKARWQLLFRASETFRSRTKLRRHARCKRTKFHCPAVTPPAPNLVLS